MDLQSALSRFAVPPLGIPENVLTGQSFQNYATNHPRLLSVRRHMLTSFKAYGTGGHTTLTFFDQNYGAATKGKGDTNMQQPNTLAGDELFVVLFVRVAPKPAQADYYSAAAGTPTAFGEWNEALHMACWLNLKIGRLSVIDDLGPLAIFGTGYGPGSVVAGNATVTKNVSWANNGSPDSKALWVLDPPVTIEAGDNIDCTANWNTAIAVTAAGRLGVHLDGYLITPVQG